MIKRFIVFSSICISCIFFNSFKAISRVHIFEYARASLQEESYVPDEVLVKFKSDADAHEIANLNARLKCMPTGAIQCIEIYRMSISEEANVLEIVDEYRNNPLVEYAEPNYYASALYVPNDPLYSYQWNFHMINMEQAWNIQKGDSTVIVAIIDTGVAYENHTVTQGSITKSYFQAPDLANTVFVPGYDFIGNNAHPNDDDGHGTHVAGTIAQSTENGIGAAGVAFNCALMPVKALDSNGSGTYFTISSGIAWAADHGAKVINLSLGGYNPSDILESALRYAYLKGATIVAAAGNNSIPRASYPAAYNDYVIAVGAVRYDETLSNYSNYGPSINIVAPGGDVSVDQNGDGYGDGVLQNTFNPNTKNTGDFGYWFFQGTSMAVPHVAGAAALLYAQKEDITPEEVRDLLQSTAKDLGAPGRDNLYGHGLVDAYAALAKLKKILVYEQTSINFEVRQNTPNPFNPTTTISFTLGEPGKTAVEVYNAAGQKAATLVDANLSKGTHSVVWNADGFSTGVYFYVVRSGDFFKAIKMLLLR